MALSNKTMRVVNIMLGLLVTKSSALKVNIFDKESQMQTKTAVGDVTRVVDVPQQVQPGELCNSIRRATGANTAVFNRVAYFLWQWN